MMTSNKVLRDGQEAKGEISGEEDRQQDNNGNEYHREQQPAFRQICVDLNVIEIPTSLEDCGID